MKIILHILAVRRGNVMNCVFCGLVVRVLGYRSGGPGSILVNTTEELLDRKVAAPV
jgi:hypothetical protein